ncbi:MAG: HAD-IA family hydrolase [Ruminococcus sp.]|nr:HAD-IA family hydrolase [Ruminococcus sp.]MDE7364310.1 HAD-IA family hydrolase [Ruminococcus sp.]
MKYDTLIFDLDGTLADTRPGVLACFEYTLNKLGLPPYHDPYKFLGPPLQYSFSTLLGLDGKATEEAVRIYRQKYRTESIFDAELFNGIEDMLHTLKENGYTLAVATCKVEKFAEIFLKHFSIAKYFDFIGGADENNRVEKSQVIYHVMEELGKTDTSRVLMIGDRDNDVKGAEILGIPCLYALWGYGSAEEASESGALTAVHTPYECLQFVMEK